MNTNLYVFNLLLMAFIIHLLAPTTHANERGNQNNSTVHNSGKKFNANEFAEVSAILAELRKELIHHGGRFNHFSEYRTIDGSRNNHRNPDWGRADIELIRKTSIDYADGKETPAGIHRDSAREISNICATQSESITNAISASDFLWQWGQFLDHDIDLTPTISPAEPFDIPVPRTDIAFDPFGTGTVVIPLDRSFYRIIQGVRQQVNEITAYIDASNVYGSDLERARELRRFDGTGRLRMDTKGHLPFNTSGLANAPADDDPTLFLAGDVRANEQIGLIAMHTLFVREHNFWAKRIKKRLGINDENTLYQIARAIVAAEIQVITYKEFLPILLGSNAISPYKGYRSTINPGIANVFSTAAYRLGHSMLPDELLRLNVFGEPIPAGNISLANAFFSPNEIMENGGIDPILRGLGSQVAQNIDPFIVDGVRNFLFGPPGAGGLDLASLNIQRGRDHGLPSYNQVRTDLGLPPARYFAEITYDREIIQNLSQAYKSIDDIDIWVGGLAENHVSGALVGETFYTILKDQFERLRDGDRFWYERYFPQKLVNLIEKQTLAKIIRRNTRIGSELQDNAFIVSR